MFIPNLRNLCILRLYILHQGCLLHGHPSLGRVRYAAARQKKKLGIFKIKILFIVLELHKQIVSTWNYKTSLGYLFLKRFFKG